MLFKKIKDDLNISLKAKDVLRVSLLRLLISEIKNFEIEHYPPAKGGELTDGDVFSVIRRLVKTHQESIDLFKKGGRVDLVSKEQEELEILMSYLPKQLNGEEIREIVKRVINSGERDFGRVMGQVMKEVLGRADGKIVSQIVREEIEKIKN